jgi:hypothetical protein
MLDSIVLSEEEDWAILSPEAVARLKELGEKLKDGHADLSPDFSGITDAALHSGSE